MSHGTRSACRVDLILCPHCRAAAWPSAIRTDEFAASCGTRWSREQMRRGVACREFDSLPPPPVLSRA